MNCQYEGVDPNDNQNQTVDTGIACLVLLLRFLQVLVESDQIKHHLGLGVAQILVVFPSYLKCKKCK